MKIKISVFLMLGLLSLGLVSCKKKVSTADCSRISLTVQGPDTVRPGDEVYFKPVVENPAEVEGITYITDAVGSQYEYKEGEAYVKPLPLKAGEQSFVTAVYSTDDCGEISSEKHYYTCLTSQCSRVPEGAAARFPWSGVQPGFNYTLDQSPGKYAYLVTFPSDTATSVELIFKEKPQAGITYRAVRSTTVGDGEIYLRVKRNKTMYYLKPGMSGKLTAYEGIHGETYLSVCEFWIEDNNYDDWVISFTLKF